MIHLDLLQGEDEQEKFERLQMALLMENPDSAAFYNAKMRTQRRVSTQCKWRILIFACNKVLNENTWIDAWYCYSFLENV